MNENLVFDRNRFAEIFNYYKKYGLAPQTGQLRFEIPIVAGKGFYEVLVNREGGAVKRATEVWLKRSDAFITKGIGMFLMIEETAKEGAAPLLTYPLLDSAALPAGHVGFASADAEAIYNGTMAIITGQVSNYQGIPLRRFKHAPETQPVQSGGESSGLVPQFDSDNAILNFAERFIFAGTKDQKIRVEFPFLPNMTIAPAADHAATHKAFIVVVVDGWLVEGGTNYLFQEMDNPISEAIV